MVTARSVESMAVALSGMKADKTVAGRILRLLTGSHGSVAALRDRL